MPEESTTPDLIELVRRQLEAANCGDLDAFMSVFAPDAVYDASRDGLGVYEGPVAIRGLIGGWWSAFDDLQLTLEELLDLGNGAAFFVLCHDARPAGSSGYVKTHQAYLSISEAGLVVRVTVYGDIDEGRASAERLAEERGQAMPSQNVEELVRWGYEWFNREKEPPPTWLPDGEFVNAREDPDHSTYRGIGAIRKQHQGWFDSYPDLHVEPLEIRANGDRVFVWTRFSGHGADSGVPMEMELAHVFTMEDGRTRRLEEYFDRAEALAAVGLSEPREGERRID